MKKIIYFDNWDKGYRNFLRLDYKFKEYGCETFLLHTTSFRESKVEKEREIEGMCLRDVSYYETINLKKILKREKPDILIMLNLSFILDRSLVSFCKDLNIKIFHLSHGKLIPSESIDSVKNSIESSKNNGLLKKINRKNIYCFYNYFIGINRASNVFLFFYNAMKNPFQYTLFPLYSKELEVNLSLVYYSSDYDIMVNEFKFPPNKVKVVGNPELDDFYNTKIISKDLFCKEFEILNKNYVAYIDDGLAPVYGWDNEKWLAFLFDLNKILQRNSLSLIVKVHPRRDISNCLDFFKKNQIKYFKDINFKNFLYHSTFVVSHFSSVVIYALLLNKKVKSPRWGVSEGLEEKYPSDVVDYYYTSNTFEAGINDLLVDTNSLTSYLAETVGDVDGKSIDRIVTTILNN